jgi:hypothetical protein
MANQIKPNKLSSDISAVLNPDTTLSIDPSSDEEILDPKEHNWDKLTQLKDELGRKIIEFISQVNAIINNQDVVSRLGDQTDYFNKIVLVFFSDINDFSKKIAEVRKQHDNLKGPIENVEDIDKFTNISITYHYLFTELANLITPTLSELMIILSSVDDQTSEVEGVDSSE